MITTQKITDDPHGRFWRYGRFYIRSVHDSGPKGWEIDWQWALGRQSVGWAGFSLGTGTGQDDEDFSASISLGRLGSWYFNAHNLPPFSWLKHLGGRKFPYDRQLSLHLNNGLISWHLWTATMGYHEGRRWRDRSWNWQRFIGWHPEHISWETLEVVRTVVPMPEGTYDATVELERGTWRRRRLFAWMPKVHHFTGEITPDKPIPVPGKGDNSWDCDDDAIYSSSGPYSTVHQAVAALVDSVYRQRTRYGSGPEWRASKADT